MAKETLGKSNSIIFITIVMQLHTRPYVSPVGKKLIKKIIPPLYSTT